MTIKKGLYGQKGFVYTGKNAQFVKNILAKRLDENLAAFISTNPSLVDEIKDRDPRLILDEVKDDTLYFKIDRTSTIVSLNKHGVFIDKTDYKTLKSAIAVLETQIANAAPCPNYSI